MDDPEIAGEPHLPAPVALEAAESFEAVMSAVGSIYDSAAERDERMARLGPAANRAYRAAGGFRDFVNVLEKDLPFLRRRFVEAYENAATAEALRDQALRALDQGALDPRAAGLIHDVTKRLPTFGRDRALPRGDNA